MIDFKSFEKYFTNNEIKSLNKPDFLNLVEKFGITKTDYEYDFILRYFKKSKSVDLEAIKGYNSRVEVLKSLDSDFNFRKFSHLYNEYCVAPVCKDDPINYNCPYRCVIKKDAVFDTSEKIININPDLINMRRAFIARPGKVIVSIDYSQIELRIATALSLEPVWITAFNNGIDVHHQTAVACFKIDNPPKYLRKLAKSCNFAALFGGTAFALARSAKIPHEEAEVVYNQWMAAVPTLRGWFAHEHNLAQQRGYISTYFGRKRDLREFFDTTDFKRVSFGKRSVISHLCQGTAADLMKRAMVLVDSEIRKRGWQDDVKMLMTIHDEIDFEITESMLWEVISVLRPIIEYKPKEWPIDLITDIEISKDWGSVKEYTPDRDLDYYVNKEDNYDLKKIIITEKLNSESFAKVKDYISQNSGGEKIILGYLDSALKINVNSADEFKKYLTGFTVAL